MFVRKKMNKINLVIKFGLAVLLFLIFQGVSFSQEKSAKNYFAISQLIEKAKEFDGQIVTIKGEAIGDLMKRRDGAWLNVSDGTAIGIFFEKNKIEAPSLKYLGNYQNTGDQLEVTGVFNKSCLYHQGELDIHCVSVKVLVPGKSIAHPISKKKVELVLALLVGFGVVSFLAYINQLKKAS
jgi:hypothetical protein